MLCKTFNLDAKYGSRIDFKSSATANIVPVLILDIKLESCPYYIKKRIFINCSLGPFNFMLSVNEAGIRILYAALDIQNELCS